MTKQERIREGIKVVLSCWYKSDKLDPEGFWDEADELLLYLHSQNVMVLNAETGFFESLIEKKQ